MATDCIPQRLFASVMSKEELVVRMCSKLEALADVWFIVGKEGEVVPANRTVLAMSSDFFKEWFFNGRWGSDKSLPSKRRKRSTESTGNEGTPYQLRVGHHIGLPEIELKDIEPAFFKVFVQFVSGNEITIRKEDVEGVLHLARMYNTVDLSNACVDAWTFYMTEESALQMYESAKRNCSDELIPPIVQYINRNAELVLESDMILTLEEDTVKDVLTWDSLVVDEIHVVNCLIRRAAYTLGKLVEQLREEKVDVGEALGELKFLIRPTLLTQKEFINLVEDFNIFTSAEQLQILKSGYRLQPLDGYNKTPRAGLKKPYGFNITRVFEPARVCKTERLFNASVPTVANYLRFKISRDAKLNWISFNMPVEQYGGTAVRITAFLSQDGVEQDIWRWSKTFEDIHDEYKMHVDKDILGKIWHTLRFFQKGTVCLHQELYAGMSSITFEKGDEFVFEREADDDGDSFLGWSILRDMQFSV